MNLSSVVANARGELGLRPARQMLALGGEAAKALGAIRSSSANEVELTLPVADGVTRSLEKLGHDFRPYGQLLANIANGTAEINSPGGIALGTNLQRLAHDSLVTTFVEGALHGRAAMSRAPRVTGNTAELLMRDGEYLPRLWNDIRNAQKSVTITMYNIENAGSGRQLLDELADLHAKRPNVDIRLVLDAHGTAEPGRERGKALLRELDEKGIPYQVSTSPLLPGGGGWEHRKIVLIDDHVVYEGGLGFAGTEAGKYGTWMDTMVRMEGPVGAVAAVHSLAIWRDLSGKIDQNLYQRLFDAQEALLGHTNLAASVESSYPEFVGLKVAEAGPPVTDVPITLLENRPGTDLAATEHFLRDARSVGPGDSFWGTSSYMTYKVIGDELEGAAQRGADTRMAVSALSGENDVNQIRIGRTFYRGLLDKGVRVFQWEGRMMHAKGWMVRHGDDAVVNVGSLNWSRMSNQFSRDTAARLEGDEIASRYEYFHNTLQTNQDLARYSGGHANEIGHDQLDTAKSDKVIGAVRRVFPKFGF